MKRVAANDPVAIDAPLAVGRTNYCSSQCGKAHWVGGHKVAYIMRAGSMARLD
jgi:hypothetical protein